VLAGLAIGRMRTAGKLSDLSRALTGRFTDHHALLCRRQRRDAGQHRGRADPAQRLPGRHPRMACLSPAVLREVRPRVARTAVGRRQRQRHRLARRIPGHCGTRSRLAEDPGGGERQPAQGAEADRTPALIGSRGNRPGAVCRRAGAAGRTPGPGRAPARGPAVRSRARGVHRGRRPAGGPRLAGERLRPFTGDGRLRPSLAAGRDRRPGRPAGFAAPDGHRAAGPPAPHSSGVPGR
jgi:hypothetical protein